MIKNYIAVALRSLKKDLFHSILNISGLSVSISCALLCLIYINHETTYENQHKYADRIYRISCKTDIQGDITKWAPAPAPLAPAIKKVIPEIDEYARIMIPYLGNNLKSVLKVGDKILSLDKILRADSTFFDLFDYDFVHGKSSALKDPYNVVISKEVSENIFGDDYPIGKSIYVNDEKLTVTGVVKSKGTRSHIDFNMLISWATFDWSEEWLEADSYTYVKLREGSNLDLFKSKLEIFVDDQLDDVTAQIDASVELLVQPLKDIHLHSNLHAEFSQNGNILYVYVFLIVAIFITLIAVINYVNIAIASSTKRAKEVGVRKSMGAHKNQIKIQFIVESFIITILSALLGVLLTIILLPYFSESMDMEFHINLLVNSSVIIMFLGLVTLISVLSGIYPAFYIASFDPAVIVRSNQSLGSANLLFRKVLSVTQFSASIVMIIVTITVINQLDFIEAKPLGFDKENLLIVSFPENQSDKVGLLKDKLKTQSFVKQLAVSSYQPGMPSKNEHSLNIEGRFQTRTLQELSFDANYINLMKLEVIEGRNFEENNLNDKRQAILINETAVKEFGWDQPIGQEIRTINTGRIGKVIGVVKDANFFSLYQKVSPVVMSYSNQQDSENDLLYVRINDQNIGQSIDLVEKAYQSIIKESPFEYTFLEDRFSQLYKGDKNLKQTLLIGCMIMIIISGLGLLALSAILAIQKTKTIAIRKVLGATLKQLVLLQTKEIFILMIIANILAIPIAFYSSDVWLQQFSYRTPISIWFFVGGVVLSLFIVVTSVAYHVVKTTKLNPVDSIKYQ